MAGISMVIYYESLCLINMEFSTRFLGKKINRRDSMLCLFVLMGLLVLNITVFQGKWRGDDQVMAAACLGVSFLYVKFCLGQSLEMVLFTGIVMYMLPELAKGIVSSFVMLLYPLKMPLIVYQVVTFSYLLLDLVLTAVFYDLLRKRCQIRSAGWNRYFGMVFLPAVLFVLFLKISGDTGFWNLTARIDTSAGNVIFDLPSTGKIVLSLFICLLGSLYLFVTVEAFQRVLQFSEKEKMNAALQTQLSMQKNYIGECILRMEKTKALRHDWKNHLTVIHQLLEKGNSGEAQHYLNKLEGFAEGLSGICSTGNASIDALLGYKFSIAEQSGIRVSCDLRLPERSEWEEFDLCVVLANAIDNALEACRCVEDGKRYIDLKSVRKGIFYMIELENSARKEEKFQRGTGLSNIERVAGKYKGKVEITRGEDFFRLCVLFVISEH